ncbi:Translation elongation factor EFG/EF2 protein [Perilla frutescens var. hirtella]|nr:Translation elongation factor EFG/EF2 protein [Perilla frutescens var. hirtella]
MLAEFSMIEMRRQTWSAIQVYVISAQVIEDIPHNLKELALEKGHELVEMVSEVDDKLGEAFLFGGTYF